MLRKRLLLPLILVFQVGCKTPPTGTSTPAGSTNQSVYHAHALLFDLLGEEKNVSKLLIIKRERAELKTLINEISQRTGKAHKELEQFARSDRSLNLKDLGLPSAEVLTRKAIAKTRAKELLTESGKDFELHLLLTQNEALVYGGHLAAIAATSDTVTNRHQMLQQLSTDILQIQRKTAEMLLKNYTWPTNK
ncbi:MAG TPA: hypothetical protein VJ063_11375 [Verrucomicrobiae bacterium]|nr:hypothetical protein [Verrucomicrobiae bacterium]